MKKILKSFGVSFFILAIILCGLGYAKLYKYKGQNGVCRFTDSPVTDEQVSGSMEESTPTANVSHRDLVSQLPEKMKPKNDIEKASHAAIGIQTPAGFGSGFFVTHDSHIITNKHILEGSEPVIETLNSDQIPTGERVFAIGNPVRLKNPVAAGILSGHENGFVTTDAKIYPGNSGSPLVDKEGRVIGINTMKLLTRNFEGLGFAIPSETALAEFQPYLPKH